MSDKPWFEEATELLAAPIDEDCYIGNDFVEGCATCAGYARGPALLKAALEEREGHQARWQSDAKWIAELSEERERLCTALAKYGTHQGDTCCGHEFGSIVQGHCDCGLDAFEPNEPKP